MTVFTIKYGNDYGSFFKNKDTNFRLGYYTANELKALYPGGGTRVAGQIGCGSDEIGILMVDGIAEKVYRANASVRYKTVGYTELADGRFIAIKKDIIALLILFIIIGLLLLAGLIAGITYAVRANTDNADGNEPNPSPSSTNSPFELDENQKEGLGELDLPEKADIQRKDISIAGIVEMKFKANKREQNFILTNPEANAGLCFMTFQIYIDNNKNKQIDANDELIYKSGLVQPGYSISKFTLNRALKAGEYQVIVLQQPYTLDKQAAPLNNFKAVTKLYVE